MAFYFFHLFEISDYYIYRIPHIGFGIMTSFFLYKITSLIYSENEGIIAAILYFVSPFFFLSGGLFIVPDAALNFSVAGTTYVAIRIIFNSEDNIYFWIALGLLLSLAFLSKYQAYLFGVTLLIAAIIWKKNIVFTKKFYASLVISLLGLVPVFLWNIENNFDSFSFHGNRSSFNFEILHVFKSLFAQFLFFLPTTSILIVMGLTKLKKFRNKQENFLIFLALPTITIFNIFILISDNSFAHWSMVGWMLLLPLAAHYFILMKSFIPQLITLKIFSFFLIFSLVSIALIHSKNGFISKSYGEKIPAWDNTRELLDWGNIANILKKRLNQDELDSLATLNWFDSGQLSSALDYKHSVIVIGPNSNHFKYIDFKEKNFVTLIDILLVNNDTQTYLSEKILDYDYKILNRMELPFFRGDRKYGTIIVLSLEKIR